MVKRFSTFLVLPVVFAGCAVSAEERLVTYIADSVCYVQDLANEVSQVESGETMSDEQMAALSQKGTEMKDELEKRRKTYFATEAELTKTFNEIENEEAFFAQIKTRVQSKCNADDKTIENIIERLD